MSAPVFYVFHGRDDFSLQAEVTHMRAQLGDEGTIALNTSEFEGRNADVLEILATANSVPFMGDLRLVVVTGLLKWYSRKGAGKTGKQALETLVARLPSLPDSTRLVMVESDIIDSANPVLKLAKSDPRGQAKEFASPKDITHWLIERAQTYQGKIEHAAAKALAQVILENDLRMADSELYKLILYTGSSRAVTEADVSLLTPYVPESSIWEIVDAVSGQQVQQALLLIHRMLDHARDVDEQCLYLLSMITRQFRLLIQLREAIDLGGTAKQVPAINQYAAQKMTTQARRFSLAELESIYHNLLEADYHIKRGKITSVLALDLFIASFTG